MPTQGADIIDLTAYRARRLAARQPSVAADVMPVMWFAPVIVVGFFAFVPWTYGLPMAAVATDAS